MSVSLYSIQSKVIFYKYESKKGEYNEKTIMFICSSFYHRNLGTPSWFPKITGMVSPDLPGGINRIGGQSLICGEVVSSCPSYQIELHRILGGLSI
jgi:hypothetical protein